MVVFREFSVDMKSFYSIKVWALFVKMISMISFMGPNECVSSVMCLAKLEVPLLLCQAFLCSSNHIERRNAAGSPQRHIHTDINTCKYLHILSTHKTHEHNQLHLCKTILSQFLPTHFSSTERPKLYKKAQRTTASDA